VHRELNQKFSSKNKLTNPAQFDQVFKKNSKTLKTGEFLFLSTDNFMGKNRLGIIVGKKNVSLSVERNRLRRLIREGFRTILPSRLGIDLVVLVRSGVKHNKNVWPSLKKLFLSVSNKEQGKNL
jgi:ribonuclease P protein component